MEIDKIENKAKAVIGIVLLAADQYLKQVDEETKKTKSIGLIWEDMNKYKQSKNIAGSGGIIVVMAFIFGVLSYIAIKTFVLKTNVTTVEIFALLTTITLASIIGFIDDIFGWVHGGLSAKIRIFLVLIAIKFFL